LIIYQPKNGYCYNSDTIFLYDFISSFPLRGKVLDIGSGSGVLGLMAQRDYPIELTSVEKQPIMAKFTEINAKANGFDIEIICGDFLELEFDKKFDFIITNPPFYHPSVLKSEKKELYISRYSENLPFEDLIKRANSILGPKGAIMFCYDAKQLQHLLSVLSRYKFIAEAIRFVHPKAEREATLVNVYAKKSSRSLCKIKEPLVVFDKDGYSQRALEAFEKADLYSIKCEL